MKRRAFLKLAGAAPAAAALPAAFMLSGGTTPTEYFTITLSNVTSADKVSLFQVIDGSLVPAWVKRTEFKDNELSVRVRLDPPYKPPVDAGQWR
jgi:hypothetical protein